MRKHLTIAALFIALLLPSLAKAQLTTTVADGTSTNSYIPIYGLWADDYTRSQMIYPASMLEDLTPGSVISSLTFFSSTASQNWGAATFDVKLGEVTETTLSSYLTSPATTVYSGSLSISNNEMTITFTTPYTYQGGNLLIELWQTLEGTYHGENFYGISANGASASGYNSSSAGSATFNQRNFLAKMEIEFVPGSGDICYRVRDIQVSAITDNGCTLTWTDTLNTGASYAIYDMSDSSFLGTAYDTTYTISGLNSNTAYTVAVVADCGTSTSSYANASFRTACGGYTNVPYFNDFEGYNTNDVPECWLQVVTGTNSGGDHVYPSVYNYSNNTYHGNGYLELEAAASSSDTEIIALPVMYNISGLTLNMWVSNSSDLPGILEVGVLEDDNSFTLVDSIEIIRFPGTNNWKQNYHEFTTYFTDYTGSGERIALRGRRVSGQYTIFIDDLTVSENNGCYPLSNLHLEAADSAEITIAWSDELNSGITYTVSYWKDGGDTTEVSGVSDTSYTASGLDASSNYNFIVVPNCSTGDGTPITGTYRTTCGVLVVPFSESFESADAIECWSKVSCHNSTGYTSGNAHSGNGSFRFYYNTTPPQYFITPQLGGTESDGILLSFWYKKYSTSYVENFKVGYSTTSDSIGAFVWGNEVNPTTSYEEFTAVYPAGVKYIAIQYMQNNGYYLYIDDFNVSIDNGCNKPNDVYIDSVGPYTVDLRWTNGGSSASSYNVYYGTQNNINNAIVVTGITDTAYTITSLLPQTTYYAWVRTDCSGDSSDAKAFGSFTTQLTCAPLTGVTMGDISYTAAVVNWSYNTTVGFPSNEVIITLVDNTDTNMAPVVVSTTGTSYTFTGLDAGHGYSVTLRNVCDVDGNYDTAANNTVNFMTTSCAEVSATGSNTSSYVPINSYYNYSYTQSIYTSAEMPNVDTINGIAFYATASDTKTIEVYMGHTTLTSLGTSNYVPASSLTQMVANYSYAFTPGWNVIPFDSMFVYDPTMGNLVVAVRNVTGSYTSTRNWATHATTGAQSVYWYQDGSSIDMTTPSASSSGTGNYVPATRFVANCEVPTCFAPMVTVDNTDSNSISIHWTVEGIENSWQVGIKAAGDANYTFNPNPVTDTFYTFTGLNAATTYTIIVSSLCIDTLSTTVTASTQCGIVAIPYFTDFEGLSTGQLPICWQQIQTGTSGSGTFPSAYNYSSNAYNGSIYFEFESNSGQTEVAALPAMNNINTLMLSFWASVMNTNFVLEAGVMEGNTFVPVDTVNLIAGSGGNWHGSYHEYEVYFSNYTGTGNRMALRVTGSGSYTLMMDDFTVSLNTGCPRPDMPVVTNVLADQISVSFSGSTSGDYMLYITDGASYVDSVSVIGDSTYTFTGLTPVTTYTIDVHADCGTAISNPRSVSATTTMVADTLPYSSGFEAGQDVSWMLVNGTQTNKWAIGSAVNNGGTNALYISDNNGVSNSYTITSTTNVYATKLFNFASAGDYTISYDWQANGESSWDYLRVFLVPGTVELTAGSTNSIGTSGSPSGWVALDGGSKLNVVNTWQNYNEVFTIANAGNYQIVFFWHNDGTGGTNPPAAIDNVQITALSCPQPQNIVVTSVTDVTATVQWTPVGSESEWAVTCNGVTTIVSTPTTVVTGLEAAHSYNVEVRAVCGMGDTSFVTTANFTTDMCGSAVTIENFDTTMTASTSSYSPIGYSLYNYSYVQTIIPASRMDATGAEITAMAFHPASTSAGTYFTNMDVYMANVSENDLASAFIMPDSAHQFVHVVSAADFSYTTTDWQVHAFDSTFTWDGQSNVLVAVTRGHGAWTSGSSYKAHNDSVQRMRYVYTDNGSYDIATVSGGTASSTVGDIRLISCGGGCAAPTIVSVTHDYESATITVSGNNIGYELEYGTDVNNLGNPMTSTTGIFNLTGLQPATQYFFHVRQSCEENMTSDWRLGLFVTDSLPCIAVSNVQITDVTYNSVSVSWTVNGDEHNWEVMVYSTVDTHTVTVQTAAATVGELMPQRLYNVNVRPMCGSNGNIEGPWLDTALQVTTSACQPVTDVTVTPGATMATVAWTAPEGASSFRVIYGAPDFGVGDEYGTYNTNDNPFVLTELEPNTPYTVRVANACTESLISQWASADFETNNQQGIDGVDAGAISLYPNPASTTVTLRVSEQMVGSTVSIVDVNGRVVYTQTATQSLTIDLSDMAKGAYFVRLTGEQSTVVRKLIVK